MKQADNSRTSNTEMITISRAEYEALQTELAEQKQQLESKSAELEGKSAELAAALLQNQWLQEQLLLKKKKIFGTSSEQIDQMVMEQFAHLFNEAEGWDRDSYVPATKVKAHSRKRRLGSITDAVPEGTAVEVVEHRLPEEERSCAVCRVEMAEIGKEVHRSLRMEPAKFWVREDRYYTYACKVCEQATGETVVKAAPAEPSVLPGSFASASAIAHLAVQKFVMHSPLYRLQQEFDRMGLKLSRQIR